MIYIIFIVLLLVSLGVNYLLIKTNQKKDKIIEQKDFAIASASQNMKHLIDYQDIIDNIKKDHHEVYNQIKEAKTDEEVVDIIHNIIDINNKHVHDS